jgi:hypothetical protein
MDDKTGTKLVLRKIADLDADEFFDFAFALTPLLPTILDLEIVQMQIHGSVGKGVEKAQKALFSELAKKKQNPAAVALARDGFNREAGRVAMRDIIAAIPKLVSRELRGFVYEGLAILTKTDVPEIKKVKGNELVKMIRRVISDIDIKDFLDYADVPEPTE